jgi:hypothetical protein
MLRAKCQTVSSELDLLSVGCEPPLENRLTGLRIYFSSALFSMADSMPLCHCVS